MSPAVGTVAVVRNNEGKQGNNPESTTLTISRSAPSVVTTTERTTETTAPAEKSPNAATSDQMYVARP